MQTDFFTDEPTAPTPDGRYAWRRAQGVTNNFHYELMDQGESTRYWVRYRIRPSITPWFIVTPWGLYPGDFAALKDAQEKVMSIKRGEHRT